MPRASPRSKRRSRPTSPRETTPSRCDDYPPTTTTHVRPCTDISSQPRPNKRFRPISSDLLLPLPLHHSGDYFFLGYRRNGSRGHGFIRTSNLLAHNVASIQDNRLKVSRAQLIGVEKKNDKLGLLKTTKMIQMFLRKLVFSVPLDNQHAFQNRERLAWLRLHKQGDPRSSFIHNLCSDSSTVNIVLLRSVLLGPRPSYRYL
jgi:hypothetical protein